MKFRGFIPLFIFISIPHSYACHLSGGHLGSVQYAEPNEQRRKPWRFGISTPTHEAAAQYIAEQWRTVLGITGIEMKPAIETYSGPDQASVQIFRDDVGTRVPDAVSYLMGAIHSGSGNARNKLGGYGNAEVDKLLEQASVKGVSDPSRNALAQQAQNIFRDEYLFIPYYYDVMSKWAMPWVNNFEKNDDWQVIEPWNVTIDEAKRP